MEVGTKSSLTLPAAELALAQALRERLGLRSNVELVRRGLRLLKETAAFTAHGGLPLVLVTMRIAGVSCHRCQVLGDLGSFFRVACSEGSGVT